MNDTDRVESNSFPIECPNPKCGAAGWVPINRLDRQLICNVCGAKFYLDVNGVNLIPGERPANLGGDRFKVNYKKVEKLAVEEHERRWRALPQRTRIAVKAGVVGVALIVILLSTVIPALKPRPKFPKDLNERARLVGMAVIRGQRDRLAAIASGSSAKDLDAWLEKVRPKEWIKSPPILQVETSILTMSPKTKTAIVTVTLIEPQAPTPQPEEEGTVEPVAGEDATVTPPGSDAMPVQPTALGAGEVPPEPGVDTGDGPGKPAAQEVPEEPPAPVEPPPVPKVPEPKKIRLTLYWLLDEGEWLIDYAQTLKYAF